MSTEELAVSIGAIYGAAQAVAQCIMMFFPQNTVIWKIAKFIVSGPARPQVRASNLVSDG